MASECEHRIVFDGLVFDGNQENMNWTDNSYNQQQGHCVFLIGPDAGASADHRLKARFNRCSFKNSVADGLSLNRNVDVIVDGIEADNCFRGGFVATGGNSIVHLRSYIGENARFDVEIDGPGFGGSYKTDFYIDGVSVDRNGGGLRPGGIDFGGSYGGKFEMRNAKVFTLPMNFSGRQDDPLKIIENCMFTLGSREASSDRFAFASNALFRQCDFVVKYVATKTNYSAIHMYPSTNLNATMEYDKCRFILDDSVKANAPSASCITAYFEASTATGSSDNGNTKYIFRDCESIGDWDEDIGIVQGGTVEVIGGSWAASSFARVVSTAGRPGQLTLEGNLNFKDTVSALFVFVSQSTQTNAFIEFRDAKLNRPVEAGSSMTTYPVIGHYEFPVTARPSSFGAVRGAIGRLDLGALGTTGNQIAVKAWVASTSDPANSAFLVADWSMAKGTTASRPVLTSGDYGVGYLDVTLDADGKPIWWNGTAWVDATGAVV